MTRSVAEHDVIEQLSNDFQHIVTEATMSGRLVPLQAQMAHKCLGLKVLTENELLGASLAALTGEEFKVDSNVEGENSAYKIADGVYVCSPAFAYKAIAAVKK